jgi:hypothetical protein
MRRAVGEEHVGVAALMHNVSTFFYIQRKFDEACVYAKQSRDIKRRALGDEHPDTRESIEWVDDIEAKVRSG